jgi:hypothetical protein
MFDMNKTNKQNLKTIDCIDCHRDTSSRARLITYANVAQQCSTNIDTCDNVDANIDDLLIKSWCARFCSRCYTYKYVMEFQLNLFVAYI